MCKYLSLRGTQFTNFNVNYLLSLEFIDVRESEISSLNLKSCPNFRLVIADPDQQISINDDADIMKFTIPVKAIGSIYDTSGVYGKEILSFGYYYTDYNSKTFFYYNPI